jgi:hypothetical protein
MKTIRRLGFRKWYERELLQSHMHLVLLLLSTLGMLGSAEAYTQSQPMGSQLTMVGCALISAAIGYWSLRRYLYLLNHAEYVADQAVCKQCDTYAKWDITAEQEKEERMTVCCRRCGNRWSIGL